MSNPNPARQTRSKSTCSARGVLNITSPFVKRQREPGEATGPLIRVMAKTWPIYKPPVWAAPIR